MVVLVFLPLGQNIGQEQPKRGGLMLSHDFGYFNTYIPVVLIQGGDGESKCGKVRGKASHGGQEAESEEGIGGLGITCTVKP